MSKKRRSCFQVLERRYCLSTVGFANHPIAFVETLRPTSVLSADLDGDGDPDVLSASYGDDKIAWYENIDGHGTFGPQRVITIDADHARAVFAGDVDGDGDLDVLSASSGDDKIAWYENKDGKGAFGHQRVITTSADAAWSVYAGDMDGDGDFDVLSASLQDDKVAWYANIDGKGTFGQQRVISEAADFANTVYAADLDNDGDLDVLSSSSGDDKVAWYENMNGQGTFGEQRVITQDAANANSVSAADIDGDGDLDVLAGSESRLFWNENTDGKGTFGERQALSTRASSVVAADMDSDGDLDVLAASRNDNIVVWNENTDGHGTFGPEQVVTAIADRPVSVFPADLDGDGGFDVLTASIADNTVAWYQNTTGEGAFGEQHVITTNGGAELVFAGDLDNDGDLDVISALGDEMSWNENLDGRGTFGAKRTITANAEGARSVFAADIDGDGDHDVLMASSYIDAMIMWFENIDGKGSFGPQQVITVFTDLHFAPDQTVIAADLDGDGDLDVLSGSYPDGSKIAWFENTDGRGTFGEQQAISESLGAPSVIAVDVDGDLDMDVVASHVGENITWYENLDGQATFGPQRLVTTDLLGLNLSVFGADIDADGDVDILSASSVGDKVVWYENIDGKGTFGPQTVITTDAHFARSVIAGDVDGDGDLDVFSASSDDDKVAWYENVDGYGTFGSQRTIKTNAVSARAIFAEDLDGDGDLDLMSGSLSSFSWHENRPVGDANDDGTFDSGDLVKVFQAGEYEDNILGNSSFDEGDWNGDGDFNSGDLVFAFQEGTFVAASVAGHVASAIDFLFPDEFDPFDLNVEVNEVSSRRGDFDGDGDLTNKDIGFLSEMIRLAAIPRLARDFNPPVRWNVAGIVDLNIDSSINHEDLCIWVKELKGTWFGDANLDGEFNSSDLVAVFQAGEYEDNSAENSIWGTGDWNGDAEFDSGDLVATFQEGGYEQGPRLAVVAVPEPSALTPFVSLIFMCAFRGRVYRR